MSQPYTPEQEEQAALSALGELSTAEAAAVPKALGREMARNAALLAESVAPVAPPPAVKQRLMARVAAYQSLKPVADVRRNESTWIPYGAPGVDLKQLFRDETTGRSTVLLRMAPGAHFPAHHHHDVEQCLVVQGDVRFGDLVYEEGDFVVMGPHTDHPEIHSVNGNILLLVAGRNEFLHAH